MNANRLSQNAPQVALANEPHPAIRDEEGLQHNAENTDGSQESIVADDAPTFIAEDHDQRKVHQRQTQPRPRRPAGFWLIMVAITFTLSLGVGIGGGYAIGKQKAMYFQIFIPSFRMES